MHSISTIGDYRTYITLTMSREENRIELVSTMFFKNIEMELSRQIADGEDDAIDRCTDMEWEAQDELRVMDIDFAKDPCGWPEALEAHFAQSRFSIAAE